MTLLVITAHLSPHIAFASEAFQSKGAHVSHVKLIYRSEVIERISYEVITDQRNTTCPETRKYSKEEEDNLNVSWTKKHPVRFGALLGLGAGFTIGFAAGDDGVPSDDASAWANGVMLGGIGAGVGALIAKIASEY